MVDFESAKDKVYMGSERRSMVMTEEDKKITAYHEAGHTVIGASLPVLDVVHKVTIIPRGRALGVTWLLPERDRYNTTKEYMEAQISFAMGGRLAEEMFFGQLSTGASNDIKQATNMARSMVTEYGMSEKAGPLNYGSGQHEIFLGRDFTQQREISEETAKLIDAEIRDIVMRNYSRAKDILEAKKECLVAIAEALLERETLDSNDVKVIMEGGTLPPPPPKSAEPLGDAFALGLSPA